MKWYRRSAEQGHADGQLSLGYMYANGLGVKEDAAEAARWFLRAAEQGEVLAQANIARMYAGGMDFKPTTR